MDGIASFRSFRRVRLRPRRFRYPLHFAFSLKVGAAAPLGSILRSNPYPLIASNADQAFRGFSNESTLECVMQTILSAPPTNKRRQDCLLYSLAKARESSLKTSKTKTPSNRKKQLTPATSGAMSV